MVIELCPVAFSQSNDGSVTNPVLGTAYPDKHCEANLAQLVDINTHDIKSSLREKSLEQPQKFLRAVCLVRHPRSSFAASLVFLSSSISSLCSLRVFPVISSYFSFSRLFHVHAPLPPLKINCKKRPFQTPTPASAAIQKRTRGS